MIDLLFRLILALAAFAVAWGLITVAVTVDAFRGRS